MQPSFNPGVPRPAGKEQPVLCSQIQKGDRKGREVWWDATRSVLSLPKSSVENSEGYEITSYHGAIHGELLGSRREPSVFENSTGLTSSCFPNVIMGLAKLFTPSLPVCRLLPSVPKLPAIESQVGETTPHCASAKTFTNR